MGKAGRKRSSARETSGGRAASGVVTVEGSSSHGSMGLLDVRGLSDDLCTHAESSKRARRRRFTLLWTRENRSALDRPMVSTGNPRDFSYSHGAGREPTWQHLSIQAAQCASIFVRGRSNSQTADHTFWFRPMISSRSRRVDSPRVRWVSGLELRR